MRRLGASILVAMGAILFLISSSAVASATSAQLPSEFGGSGVLHYAQPNPQARHIVVRGHKTTSGNCDFVLTGTVAAGQANAATSQYNEIAFNAADCTSLIEVSQPTSSPNATSPQESQGGAGQAAPGRGAMPRNGAVSPHAACANPFRDGSGSYADDACIHSWFTDPPGLHVNDLTNEIQWNPNGTCALAGSAFGSEYYQYLSGTGWSVNSHQYSPTFSCSGVTSHTTIVFQNTAFCAGILAVLTGYNQQITGNPNGSYNWSVTWAKNGVCSGLLTFHTEQHP